MHTGRGWCFWKGMEIRKHEFLPFVPTARPPWRSAFARCVASFNRWPGAKGPFSMLSFLLGPSTVVRIVLVLILSTSFVIQKTAPNTLRTSEHSSASNVTRTSSTRTPGTTGYHMSIPTVSRCSPPFLLCACGLLIVSLVNTEPLDSGAFLGKLENSVFIGLSPAGFPGVRLPSPSPSEVRTVGSFSAKSMPTAEKTRGKQPIGDTLHFLV